MIILSTLQLPPTLVWTDRHVWQPVMQTARRTLSGGMVVYHRQLNAGRPITLEAGQTWGWLSAEQVEALESMAAAPGAVYPFEWQGESYQVCFRHDEPPALSLRSLRPNNPAPGAATRYIGQIKLMTI